MVMWHIYIWCNIIIFDVTLLYLDEDGYKQYPSTTYQQKSYWQVNYSKFHKNIPFFKPGCFMLCGTRTISARSVGICDGLPSTAQSSFYFFSPFFFFLSRWIINFFDGILKYFYLSFATFDCFWIPMIKGPCVKQLLFYFRLRCGYTLWN